MQDDQEMDEIYAIAVMAAAEAIYKSNSDISIENGDQREEDIVPWDHLPADVRRSVVIAALPIVTAVFKWLPDIRSVVWYQGFDAGRQGLDESMNPYPPPSFDISEITDLEY